MGEQMLSRPWAGKTSPDELRHQPYHYLKGSTRSGVPGSSAPMAHVRDQTSLTLDPGWPGESGRPSGVALALETLQQMEAVGSGWLDYKLS